MKHIFIVNPAAGPVSPLDEIREKLNKTEFSDSAEIYVTHEPQDATKYVRMRCSEEPNETLRFYACGGDGTLNEVADGAMGFENAEVSCYPCGSGNDYIKYYGNKEDFCDLDTLMHSEAQPIDMMSVCGRHCINVCNFGFDAKVAQTMAKVRRKKIIGGNNAYTTGIVNAIFTAMNNNCKVYADGELLNPKGKILLCTVANGQYVGGAYRCAPRSLNNDGALEVCLVTPVSIFKFLQLIGVYKIGGHFDDRRFDKYIIYKRAKKVEVVASDGFNVCMDGEMTQSGHYSVEVIPGAIKFAAPTKVTAKV